VEDLLLLCVLAFFAGLVDAVAGGGGLIQVPALFAFAPGIPPVALLGTNKLSSTAGTAAALLRYQRTGFIDWRGLRLALALAAPAAALGAWAVSRVPADWLRPVVLILLLLVCGHTLLSRRLGLKAPEQLPQTGSPAPYCTAIGFYDGFFGPGAGAFLVFGLVRWFRRGFLQAAAETKAINLATNIGALTYFALNGHLNYRLGLAMALANLLGGYVGAATAVKNGAVFVRRVFLGVAAALILKLGWDVIGA
jgi:uncharacterized protein